MSAKRHDDMTNLDIPQLHMKVSEQQEEIQILSKKCEVLSESNRNLRARCELILREKMNKPDYETAIRDIYAIISRFCSDIYLDECLFEHLDINEISDKKNQEHPGNETTRQRQARERDERHLKRSEIPPPPKISLC